MAIGLDIKEVHSEIGAQVTILRDAGNITGEYVVLKVNRQVTKPFVREFFVQGEFSYDSQVVSGDVVQVVDGRKFIVMNRTPEIFENAIAFLDCVLYKVNVAGSIYRLSVEKNAGYKKVPTWTLIKAPCYGLLTEALFGNELADDDDAGQLELTENDLFLPAAYGLEMLDRFEITATDYHQIETIKKRRFALVDYATVGEDTRGARPV